MKGKDVYRSLGNKIDNLNVRAPWNETWHSLLKELYTPEEADTVARMPYTLSSLDRISQVTGMQRDRLQAVLERLCRKGLVMDLWNDEHSCYYYMPWPIAIGIFELTMMRTGEGLNFKGWAELFHDYFGPAFKANFSNDEKVSAMRVIPIEESIDGDAHTVFFDYERATSIIESSDKMAIGICSCRNEKMHIGKKTCDAPMDTCSLFGIFADYAIRYGLAREVSRSEMLENFSRSREQDLVLCSVNTKRNPRGICQCCKCCCNFLGGLNRFGYTNIIISSNYISNIDEDLCSGCGKCIEVCPVNALSLVSANDPKNRKRKKAGLNSELCAGCGLCTTKCKVRAIKMIDSPKRPIHPESLFEVTMLSALERGTLQNQLFDNPQSMTQKFARIFVGAFLKLSPVKKALMSDLFRSTFLSSARMVARLQGKGWMVEL
jgi:Na+-translocating ferredoxin:NAD+ oxidoreductase RNF subunit RnfB